MALALPRLETEIDCAPLGYPGLRVVYWLNVTYHEEPEESGEEPWDKPFYHQMGRQLLRVIVPAEYTDDNQEQVIEVGSAQALWELERMPGLDAHIIIWSASMIARQRSQRMEDALKN